MSDCSSTSRAKPSHSNGVIDCYSEPRLVQCLIVVVQAEPSQAIRTALLTAIRNLGLYYYSQ